MLAVVLIDSDDDCPAELGPDLLLRGSSAYPELPIGVVIAKMEYESRFLAPRDRSLASVDFAQI